MILLKLLKYELNKELVDFKHYSINYLFNILNQGILCLLFMKMFFNSSSNLFDFLLKILVWWIGADLITKMPYVVLEEKNEGTLEFIFSNLKNLEIFLFSKTVSMLLMSLLTYLLLASIIFLVGLYSFENVTFTVDLKKLLLAILALGACAGYGYLFSGVTLLYKKTSTMVNTFGYLLLLGQFTDFKGALGTIMKIIPSTWIRFESNLALTSLISLSIIIFGVVAFSYFLKLSLKSGRFWR